MTTSSVPNGVGSCNTKRPSPASHWCFTLNNYTENDIEMILGLLVPESKVYAFQEEIGKENGTPHLQGYIRFKRKVRPMSLSKWTNRIHWELSDEKREMSAVRYCLKTESRKENGRQWTNVELPENYKKIITLRKWQKTIVEILKERPDDRTIYWFWESEGNFGKTTFCKYIYTHFENVVVLGGKGADMKNGIIEYLKTNHRLPEIVLINVPRSSQDFISYTGMEEVKDMFFYSGKYEGGMVCGPNPHLIVFANEAPDLSKMSDDRWRIMNLKTLNKEINFSMIDENINIIE
jgi:hypothetical protein